MRNIETVTLAQKIKTLSLIVDTAVQKLQTMPEVSGKVKDVVEVIGEVNSSIRLIAATIEHLTADEIDDLPF